MEKTTFMDIKNLHKSYGDNEVLKGVDMQVHIGEKVIIMGASGSGKSTFLRCLNHLEKANEGTMRFDDVEIEMNKWKKSDLHYVRNNTAMVFQGYNLFAHKNVLQNVTEGLIHCKKIKAPEAKDIAIHYLTRVGMKERLDFYPSALSGGQQQRVAIARALALSPKAILFDEPTSALDPDLVGEVLDVMSQVAEEGVTMLVVTHEVAFARKVADKIVFMDGGRVCEEGTPDQIFNHPQNERTKNFLNLINRLSDY